MKHAIAEQRPDTAPVPVDAERATGRPGWSFALAARNGRRQALSDLAEGVVTLEDTRRVAR